MNGKIKSINISGKKGEKKRPVKKAIVIKGLGIKGDAHASAGNRRVSLLSIEQIRGMGPSLKAGDFAENITTEGVDLSKIKTGDIIKIGMTARLAVTQIAKECHSRCKIYEEFSDCVMSKAGVFARVLDGGKIKIGDKIEVKA